MNSSRGRERGDNDNSNIIILRGLVRDIVVCTIYYVNLLFGLVLRVLEPDVPD